MEEEDGDMKVSFYPSLFNKKKKKRNLARCLVLSSCFKEKLGKEDNKSGHTT